MKAYPPVRILKNNNTHKKASLKENEWKNTHKIYTSNLQQKRVT